MSKLVLLVNNIFNCSIWFITYGEGFALRKLIKHVISR